MSKKQRALKKPNLIPAMAQREMGAAPFRLIAMSEKTAEFLRIADRAKLIVQNRSGREGTQAVTRVIADPLDWYLHNGYLNNDQWSAGDRLRRDHYIAFGSGYHSINLDGFHGVTDYTENWRVTHRQSEKLRDFIRVMNTFPMAERHILVCVCIRGMYANDVARKNRIHPRKGILVLREILNDLATYYRTGRNPRRVADAYMRPFARGT